MRVYISGKMTGIPAHNAPAFSAAAEKLRSEGHFVINPHDITRQFGSPEEVGAAFEVMYYSNPLSNIESVEAYHRRRTLAESVMSADLAAVRSCDAIYLLRGWEQSRGAKKELHEAIAHGLRIMLEGGEG